ncbi:hypothetical protein ABZP36_030678 [Zizania latifolia]
MPGSILVSVAQPPAIAPLFLQVALGKREYNGNIGQDEFSFPVTSLRESMVMLLYNGDRSFISPAELKTKAVVESGTLDVVFSLDNGGSIVLRLQFLLLSDEDRKRVQEMRNSAKKRKQQELLSDGSGLSQDSALSKQPEEKHISKNIPSKGDQPTLGRSMSLDDLQEKATRESLVQSVGRNRSRFEDPIDSKKPESRLSSAVKKMIAFESSSSQGPNLLTRIKSESSLKGMPASSDNFTKNSHKSSTPSASLVVSVAGTSGEVQPPSGDTSFSSRSGKHHVVFSNKRSNPSGVLAVLSRTSEGGNRMFSNRDRTKRLNPSENGGLNNAEMLVIRQNRTKKRSLAKRRGNIGPYSLEQMHPHVCITTANRQAGS